jgi:hypothetical protein
MVWLTEHGACLDWTGALPPEDFQHVSVYCPLVYSPSGWAIQKLTVLELMAACDVSKTLLLSKEWQMVDTSNLPSLHSAPSRLLCVVLDMAVRQATTEVNQTNQLSPLFGLQQLVCSGRVRRTDT